MESGHLEQDRKSVGETPTLLEDRGDSAAEPGEQGVERQADHCGSLVTHGIGEDEPAAVDECAAAIDHVRHIALALVAFGGDQGFVQPAENPHGFVEI